jgi:translin
MFSKRLYPSFQRLETMTLKNVKPSLNKIAKDLGQVQDAREFLLKNTREIIILCSKSIIAVHKGDLSTGKNNLKQAETLLKKYKKKATGGLRRYLITPEQEFVEAACLIAIVEQKEIPSDKKLSVMPESYVLGLLDCVGELKRQVFDKIRIGEIDDATRIRALKLYKRHTQKNAIDFVDYVMGKFPFRIHTVRTDRGHEWQAKFHWHVEDQGMRHVYIKPGTPRLNGKVERSHRTDKEEFYQLLSYTGDVDLKEKLNEWEAFYNFQRPHGAFKGKTPYEILKEKLL